MLRTRIYSLADLSLLALWHREPSPSLAPWPLRGWYPHPELGVLTNLRFRDLSHLKAGMFHESFPVWQRLLADCS